MPDKTDLCIIVHFDANEFYDINVLFSSQVYLLMCATKINNVSSLKTCHDQISEQGPRQGKIVNFTVNMVRGKLNLHKSLIRTGLCVLYKYQIYIDSLKTKTSFTGSLVFTTTVRRKYKRCNQGTQVNRKE